MLCLPRLRTMRPAWLQLHGNSRALVIATPRRNEKRACRWSAGKRQVVEQVVSHLKDHRARTLSGLLARIAARMVAYTIGLPQPPDASTG